MHAWCEGISKRLKDGESIHVVCLNNATATSIQHRLLVDFGIAATYEPVYIITQPEYTADEVSGFEYYNPGGEKILTGYLFKVHKG
jgi:hypothetical protein